jgi:hypothetical protein
LKNKLRDHCDEGRNSEDGKYAAVECASSNALNVVGACEGKFTNPPDCMFTASEGIFPNFNEAFTELHLGQLFAFEKCFIGDRRDGGIDQNAYYILRSIVSVLPCVDEDVSIDYSFVRQQENLPVLFVVAPYHGEIFPALIKYRFT